MRRIMRQLRLSEFRLLLVALLLITVALSAIGALSDRMEQSMQVRTSAILGADAMIASRRPLDEQYEELARAHGLELARSVSFLSMVRTQQRSLLAGVRAVSRNYPLRGEVVTRYSEASDAIRKNRQGPVSGEIWMVGQISGELVVKPGDVVDLGELSARYTGQILLEPEGGVGVLRFAPRVIMNLEDLEATGLLTPASRVHFRLMVAGDPEALRQFKSAIVPQLKSHERWDDADISRQEVRSTVGRIISYIRLAVLLSVILAVVAMALAAHGLRIRQANEAALFRCLGQSDLKIFRSVLGPYLTAGIPVILLGAFAGFSVQEAAAWFILETSGIELPAPSPVVLSVILLICLLAYIIVLTPALVSVGRIPPLILLREAAADRLHNHRPTVYSVFLLVVLLICLLSGDWILAAAVLAGFSLCTALLWSGIRLMISVLGLLVQPRSSCWFVAFKTISANPGRSAWIAGTFGIIVFALIMLGIIRSDIFEAWEQSLPDNAPNLFLINIQDSNRQALVQLLDRHDIAEALLYPIIRGRLAAINAVPASEAVPDSEEPRHRVSHEFNMTETDVLPKDNRIAAGTWMPAQGHGFSVEQETAELLGLELGDHLQMDVAGSAFQAPITSIREVKWENMQSNFYIIATPGLFEDTPRNYITALHVQPVPDALSFEVSRNFPGITAINLEMILNRFRTLVEQGSRVISLIFLFTLLCAVLVLIGILQGQRTARRLEIALFKSLGASRRFMRSAVVGEFILLGSLAGMLGGGLGVLTSRLLARYLFELTLDISWAWVLVGVLVGVLAISITGYWCVRRLFDVVPVRLLSHDTG